MTYINNVMIVRHKLLSTTVERWCKDRLVKAIDRVPLELSPRKNRSVLGRCCPHKERAVWKCRMFPLLSFDMWDEEDELTPLSEHANTALHRPQPTKENVLYVIGEACTPCVQIDYEISNLCRGCVSRACSNNCPKSCISPRKNGRAQIGYDVCISYGQCRENYPYHAVVYIPVPCKKSYPMGAVSKDEDGIEHIDESKYIYYGSCLNTCPFGTIFEISQAFDVLSAIEHSEQVMAIVAPAILGQLKAAREQVYGAIKKIGFHDVIEVAQDIVNTMSHEGKELVEKIEADQAFMTTPCCPFFYELMDKHAPGLKPLVSNLHSPMVYTAEHTRRLYPDNKVVFFDPCAAKRKEIERPNVDVDMMVTFEGLDSILEGLDIDINTVEGYKPVVESVREAHAFVRSGGIKDAVISYLSNTEEYKNFVERLAAEEIAGMDKKVAAEPKVYGKRDNADARFVEVMACLGGYVTGPNAFNNVLTGRRQLLKEVEKTDLIYASYKEQE